MLFERYRLHPALARNLEEGGFRRPTDIQFRAIPAVLDGNDLLAIAQTGTGKTMAFAVPTIHLLTQLPEPRESFSPRALVMVPTHELALQILRVFKSLTQGTGLKLAAIIGGKSVDEQMSLVSPNVDIIIATPGRMNDLGRNRLINLSELEILVLDEADKMLEMGFKDDIHHILRHIPRRRQTLFFSATISPTIKKLAYALVVKPIRIEIAPEDPVSKNIDHSVLEVDMDDKRFFLERLVKEHAGMKILVFTRTQVRAERVQAAMQRVGIEAGVLHGGLEREARREALDTFARGEVKLLIATDLSARGLDIQDIAYVVNYDMPREAETYVHRIGRTGRGKNRGIAVSFCAPEEEPLRRNIEKLLGHFIQVLDLSEEEYEGTKDFSVAAETDWKTLMKRHQEEQAEWEKKHKKRVKKGKKK